MSIFSHSTYSATGIKQEMNTCLQTNISLLVYDDSTINQKYWWAESDRAQAAGTSVHSSCSMQTVKRLILTAIKYWKQLQERQEKGCTGNIFIPNVNANNKYNQYPVFSLLQF
jgi:phage gp46-like protein